MFKCIETPLFSKIVERYLSDDDYAELQTYLSENPEAGDIIRGSDGVRKLQWAAQGHGKRGGVRIIYYLRRAEGHIWMLTLYAKNIRETIPAHVLRQIREVIEGE